jgi:two-component system LytT family response regulator
MKAILIDDEPKARQVLNILLDENCPNVEVVATAEDLLTGIQQIRKHRPDIVFLDIEMPEHNGLEILELYGGPIDFQIIFTTAYNNYAIEAFELSAIDYLLKPLRPEKLKQAVEKAEKASENHQITEQLKQLKQSLTEANFTKIGLPYAQGIKFVEFDDILVIKASGMYTEFFMKSAEKMLVSKPLKHFSTLLENHKIFYRPHRSYLLNLKHIKEYLRSEGGFIVMENGVEVPVSKEKREEFLNIVSNI